MTWARGALAAALLLLAVAPFASGLPPSDCASAELIFLMDNAASDVKARVEVGSGSARIVPPEGPALRSVTISGPDHNVTVTMAEPATVQTLLANESSIPSFDLRAGGPSCLALRAPNGTTSSLLVTTARPFLGDAGCAAELLPAASRDKVVLCGNFSAFGPRPTAANASDIRVLRIGSPLPRAELLRAPGEVVRKGPNEELRLPFLQLNVTALIQGHEPVTLQGGPTVADVDALRTAFADLRDRLSDQGKPTPGPEATLSAYNATLHALNGINVTMLNGGADLYRAINQTTTEQTRLRLGVPGGVYLAATEDCATAPLRPAQPPPALRLCARLWLKDPILLGPAEPDNRVLAERILDKERLPLPNVIRPFVTEADLQISAPRVDLSSLHPGTILTARPNTRIEEITATLGQAAAFEAALGRLRAMEKGGDPARTIQAYREANASRASLMSSLGAFNDGLAKDAFFREMGTVVEREGSEALGPHIDRARLTLLGALAAGLAAGAAGAFLGIRKAFATERARSPFSSKVAGTTTRLAWAIVGGGLGLVLLIVVLLQGGDLLWRVVSGPSG